MKTGIDAIAFDVAQLHLPIKSLANARNIEPEKLEKGLGLLAGICQEHPVQVEQRALCVRCTGFRD